MPIPSIFNDRMTNLAAHADADYKSIIYAGLLNNSMGVSSAYVPHDPQNPAFWATVYNRSTLNYNYGQVVNESSVKNGYRSADLQVLKTAIDYMASAERAAQASDASRIRCVAWSSGRKRGHASTFGPFGNIVQDLNYQLAKAYSEPNDPSGL